MEYKTIIVSETDMIGKITFNRPPLNVLNIEMMKEINAALEDLSHRNLKAVILNANGKAFSAGVDVSDHTPDKVNDMISIFHAIFSNMRRMGVPFIAMVEGAALGGGCEVAAFCDIILASDRAKFGQPEIMVGVFPPVACATFPKIFGPKKGMELVLTGDTIKADEAKDLGLVNHVFPADAFQAEAERFIKEKIASKSSVVLKLTKKAFLEGCCQRYEQAIKPIERIYLDEMMKTADANEGLMAFLEKRQPSWQNK